MRKNEMMHTYESDLIYSKDALKFCPLCNGEPVLRNYGMVCIECKKCKLSIERKTEHNARKAWNKRVELPKPRKYNFLGFPE